MTTRISQTVARPVARVAMWHTRFQWRRFMRGLDQCQRVQEQLLMSIVRANQDSDFGRRHGFPRVHSYKDFTRALPPAQYSYHAPFIERCKEGETTALFGPSQRLLGFALTSGTMGKAKYIPVTGRFIAAYRHGWNLWGLKSLADHPQAYVRKVLQVASPVEQKRTAGGHPCGPISAVLARHQKVIVRYFYAAPREVAAIADPHARFYTTMRLAITEDIGSIVTANPSTLVMLAQTADRHAEVLIRDIRDGTVSSSMDLPASLRAQLTRSLRPNRKRSRQLERVREEHGRLLPKHYWDPAVLAHWTGGTVGLYLPQVRRYYGDRPTRDIGLLASEGRMSIPTQDGTAAGVLDIFANFYEFIPAEQLSSFGARDEPATLPEGLTVLRAHELEKGQQYFILPTNHAGLYRYHLGDLIVVTDYMGPTPVIEFLSRGAYTSSMTGEKLTEHQVVAAVSAVMQKSSIDAATFTVTPVWADPPYYLLRLNGTQTLAAEKSAQLAREIDESLQRFNSEYRSKRRSHRLGSFRISETARRAPADHDSALPPVGCCYHEQYKHRFLLNEPIHPGEHSDELRLTAFKTGQAPSSAQEQDV